MPSARTIAWLRLVVRLERRSRTIRETVHDFPWVHTLVGLFGNLTFFVGSVFFFWESWKIAGVWLFVVGSFAMLVGSLGSALSGWERRLRRRHSGHRR